MLNKNLYLVLVDLLVIYYKSNNSFITKLPSNIFTVNACDEVYFKNSLVEEDFSLTFNKSLSQLG